MQILELSAANEKEAIKYGAELLQVDTNTISAKMHKKGASGFLGLGAKDPSVFFIETVENTTPNNGVMRGVVLTLLSKMGLEAEIDKIEDQPEEKICISMSSTKAGHIIGKRGKTLESLQFLTNLLVQQYSGEPPKILLDIENYRDRRAKYLTDFAIKMASGVAKYGKSRLMEPLNPFERRLIHVALQEDDRVETESEGVGVYKRVRIKSKRGPQPSHRKSEQKAKGNKDDMPGEERALELSEEEEEKLSQSIMVDPEDHGKGDFAIPTEQEQDLDLQEQQHEEIEETDEEPISDEMAAGSADKKEPDQT